MKAIGKISWFGGPNDSVMSYFEGLAFYEHHEADKHPDLFLERSKDTMQGTSKRLRCEDAYYIALNIPEHYPRKIVQQSHWRVMNLTTGDSVVCKVVDRGPGAAGRLVDASRALMRAIGLDPDKDTDVEVGVNEVSQFDIPFGLYKQQ